MEMLLRLATGIDKKKGNYMINRQRSRGVQTPEAGLVTNVRT